MYLVADVGGTKTLVALITKNGDIKQKIKFPTPKKYTNFVEEFTTKTKPIINKVDVICLAVPGLIDRKHGIGIAFGNLAWKKVDIAADIKKSTGVKTIIENDAKAGGLSEALEVLGKYRRSLYVAIGTGIGVAFIENGRIAPALQDTEAGMMMLQRNGKLQKWESFASGNAIKKRFGKEARNITDQKTWEIIAKDIAQGLLDLVAVIQPEIIIIGGGIGTHFKKYEEPLLKQMKKYETPLAPIPPIVQAKHPEEAVLLGGYYLIKQYEKANS